MGIQVKIVKRVRSRLLTISRKWRIHMVSMNRYMLPGALALFCGMMYGAGYEPVERGVVVRTGKETVRVVAVSDRIFRVSATPDSVLPETASLAVVTSALPAGPDKSRLSVRETEGDVALSTAEVTAKIDRASGAVSFFDRHGKRLLAEDSRSFTPVEVEGTSGYSVAQSFLPNSPDEGIYGLGQHQSDEFNYRGRNEELFQYNTKVSVPFVVSTEGYGLLWDSYSLCRWGEPDDYSQLGEVFALYDRDGAEGALTGTYTDKKGTTLTRREPRIYFEHLIRGDLGHVVNLPQDFNFSGSHVVFEGEIEPRESGVFSFILYYSGYQTVEIDGKSVVERRWRTSWNPNSYKFEVSLEKGRRVPIKIDWEPNGSVAYCGLRVYPPAKEKNKGAMRWWGEMQDMEDYYFVYGPTPDEVISGYRTLTGKAPIMPKWAMGYWQSREKYNTQREVLGTLAEFRKRRIPIDNIVIDWLHWPQDAWGSHEFDRKRFPDPKGMVDTIHAMDARVMVSVWPKFYTTTEHYKEFDSRGWMYQGAVRDSIRDWVGPGYTGSFYDAYNPGARKLFWRQLEEHYVPLGIDAWWMDASEPNIRDCTDIQYRKDLMTPTFLGPSAKYFNAYALMNADAIYNGQRSAEPDRRVFLLTRSGFAGLQRYSTATWSGDIATRWEDMRAQISAGLNFSISGIPWWTMDIGGFCVEDRYVKAQKLFDKTGEENDDLREWRELNTRWYQFGCFAPLFRAHGQWPRREVFNIAPEGHPAYESIVRYTRLRYNLMPYIYSLAAMTHFDDYTIMRPMVMDFTSDLQTRGLKDQYMFGPALMAAPVCEYGARSREVCFPAGETWYDFYTGLHAGADSEVDAPYERMPLFVRGGSILPLGPDVQSTAEVSDKPLTVFVYAGRDGAFTLYEDEGTNYDYERGLYSKIRFEYSDTDSRLTIRAREGEYPGMLRERRFNVVKVDGKRPAPAEYGAKGKPVKYKGKEIHFKL